MNEWMIAFYFILFFTKMLLQKLSCIFPKRKIIIDFDKFFDKFPSRAMMTTEGAQNLFVCLHFLG